MGLKLINIIIETNEETDSNFIHRIKERFSFFNVKVFNSPFNGIIGQLDVNKMYYECEELNEWEKYGLKTTDEIMDKMYDFEIELIDFSKLFSNKIFGYIEIDCFGGTCYYEGFIIINGEIIYKQESAKDGHINILKRINKEYDGYYFEPFTREFINKNV